MNRGEPQQMPSPGPVESLPEAGPVMSPEIAPTPATTADAGSAEERGRKGSSEDLAPGERADPPWPLEARFSAAALPPLQPPAGWPAAPGKPGAPAAQADSPCLMWKIWGILMALCLVGSAAGVPYALAFFEEGVLPQGPYWYAFLYVSSVVTQFLPCLPTGALGLWLGEKTGLGAPVLQAWLTGQKQLRQRYGRSLGLAFLVGLAVGLPLTGLALASSLIVPSEIDSVLGEQVSSLYSRLTPLKGLGGALMAGITEEVWFRLGLMTLIVFVLRRLFRLKETHAWVAWLANVLAVLPFGLLHLTNVGAIGAPINLWTTATVVVLNGAAGVVFGWLYWRRGLESAMLAHFSMDIVLHVLAPLLLLSL